METVGLVLYVSTDININSLNSAGGIHGYLYKTPKIDKQGYGLTNYVLTENGYNKNKDIPQVQVIKYIDYIYTLKENDSREIIKIKSILNIFSIINSLRHNLIKVEIMINNKYIKNNLTEMLSEIYNGTLSNKEYGLSEWKDIKENIAEHYNVNGTIFNFNWIKRSEETIGTEVSNKLATIGVISLNNNLKINEFIESDTKGYWKNEDTKNPLLSLKKIYFNSNNIYNIKGRYLTGNPGKSNILIGKKTPDAVYSVVQLDEPDERIEFIKDRQNQISKSINRIMVMHLDNLYLPTVSQYYSKYNDSCFNESRTNILNIEFLKNTIITSEQNPPGLIHKAIESLMKLSELLNLVSDIKNNIDYDKNNLVYFNDISLFDVTNQFFDISEKTVKSTNSKSILHTLKKEITTGTLDHLITSRFEDIDIKIKVNFGIDIPSRNSFKKLELTILNASVVFWKEGDGVLRYCFYIKTNQGSGIWCNFYSNLILIN